MSETKHYLELDGLRGVAAVAVGLYHEQSYFGGPTFLGHGYLAVDFFFMLSGFVLMHAYGPRLTAKGSFGPFVRDRVIRLYPMLLVGASLGLLVATRGHSATQPTSTMEAVSSSALNALALPDLSFAQPFWINSPVWSLFFEIMANLLFALVAFALTSRRLIVAAVLLGCATVAADLYYGNLDFGWYRASLPAGFIRVGAGFFVGVLLYEIHLRGFLQGAAKRWWVSLVLLGTFALLPTQHPLSIVYDPFIVLIVYPFLILAGAGSASIIPHLAKLSGAISYPFYVIHVPLLRIVQYALKRFGIDPGPLPTIASIVVVLGVSWAVLTFYDEPVRRLLRRTFRTRPVLPPSAAAVGGME